MVPFVVACQGQSWQEDFGPVAQRVYGLYRAHFRRWPDAEDRVQEAVCFLMEDFAKQWKPGGSVVVWTYHGKRRVEIGRTFVRRTRTGKSRRPNKHRDRTYAVRAEGVYRLTPFAVYHRWDAIFDAENVSPQTGQIVRLLLAGFSLNQAAERAGIHYRHAMRKLRGFLAEIGVPLWNW